jgi:hypothetical protein
MNFRRKRYVDVVFKDGRVDRFTLDPQHKVGRLWVYIGLDGSLNVSNGDPDKEKIAWR